MDNSFPTEHFTGAYATPGLVGREGILTQIRAILNSSQQGPRVIFLTGEGGIGKTRLLRESLEIAKNIPGVKAAEDMVDFYHMPMHTSNGLAEALYKALTPPTNPFLHYSREQQTLERWRLVGQVSGVSEQRQKAVDAFCEDMGALAKTQRIVLALDTAEKLVYGLSVNKIEVAEAWEWLSSSLSQWGNVTLLIAGRPESNPLRQKLQNLIGAKCTPINVGPFSEDESLYYFKAVQKVAEENGADEVARIVGGLSDDSRRMAHIYSGGQPILLALLVDHLSIRESLPDILRASLQQAQGKTPDEIKQIRSILEEQLIRRLREAGEVGDTILALGRIPKGGDHDLLAKLLDITPQEAAQRLKDAQSFSFVKTRPSDERVFLHDEMYALLKRRVYEEPEDAPQAEKAYSAILAYYEELLESCRKDLDKLFAPIEAEHSDRLDLSRASEINTRRQGALVEDLYYRFRQDAIKGYQRFYRYNREATFDGDVLLSIQFQTEMLAFVAETDPSGQKTVIDGLERELVDWSIMIRPVLRAWAGQKYPEMLKIIADIQEQAKKLSYARAPISLKNWEAYARIYLGGEENLRQARALLDEVVEEMNGVMESGKSISSARRWRNQAVLAFAYRVRGYLQRVQYQMQGAVEDYRRSVALFRAINLQTELATALNDLGFAMSELGFWNDGRALVKTALDIRRTLGARGRVGLSLNTLAMIDLRAGLYEAAITNATSALALFRAMGDQRGAGLALRALAEAHRRSSGTLPPGDVNAKVEQLRQARDYAREAVDIFTDTQEKSRLVEAYIELGCACRNWAHLRADTPNPRDDLKRLSDESRQALENAVNLTDNVYEKIDALIDLAWLGFYIGDQAMVASSIKRADAEVGKKYLINRCDGKPEIDPAQAQVLIWTLIGKSHILRGNLAFQRYTDPSKASDLCEAIEHYVLGLQYSAFYSPAHPRLQQVKDEIYDRLKNLSDEQLNSVAKQTETVEKEYCLGESVMRVFLQNRALWYSN